MQRVCQCRVCVSEEGVSVKRVCQCRVCMTHYKVLYVLLMSFY